MSKLRLSHIRYFLVLCEELQFTRAARRCAISQPSLSNAIKSLEEELGGPLFERTQPLRLTALGKAARPHLRHAIGNFDRARAIPDPSKSNGAEAARRRRASIAVAGVA